MKTLFKFILVLFILGIMGVAAGGAFITYVSSDLPEIDSLQEYNPAVPSKIVSSDNEVLLELGKENREMVAIAEVPKRVIDAFISAEDDNFYSHSGIDYKGIARATLINLKAGRVVQGASTITQQVAKSLLLSSERTFTRKIKDLLLALEIEKKLSKDEILFLYLNQVYLGGGYYGIKSAFEGYFEKSLEEASIAECALVAGLLVAPGRYSPYINPKYAKKRQRYVLRRLYKTGKISKAEYDQAKSEDIKLHLRRATPMKGGYFTDWVRQVAFEKLGKEEFLTKGYTINTSIDYKLQQKAEQEVKQGVLAIDKRQGYKGPLGKREDREAFLAEKREELYKGESEYFVFNRDGTTTHEYDTKPEDLAKLKEKAKEKLAEQPKWFRRHYLPGNQEEDNINSLIKIGENYEGIVVKVNNLQKIVYVKFAGGLVGVIPEEHFKWAHKRDTSVDRAYYPPLTRPSRVFKPNDIVLVKVLKEPTGMWASVDSAFKKAVKNEKLIEAIQAEKYYILGLEQEPDVQAALVSISPSSGRVLAMVGGYDFGKSQFNRAIQSNRQPGSSFKPLLYAASLENGYHPSSILLDTPAALGSADANLDWKPQNYDGKFKGEMTLRRALETSRNIPTIKLVQDVGVKKVNDFIKRFNPNLKLPKDLSIALGSFGINLLELVKMYAVFPNRGRKVEVKSILSVVDKNGEEVDISSWKDSPLDELPASPEEADDLGPGSKLADKEVEEERPNEFHRYLGENQVYDPRLAYLMNNLLRGVVRNGTGAAARSVSPFIGGKTGTTNNYVDAWFLGYAPNIVTGVWTGFDNNDSMGFGETGSRSALPIWKEYMAYSLSQLGQYDFVVPSGIINVSVNKETGRLANPNDTNSYREAYVTGHGPADEEENFLKEDDANTLLIDDEYYSGQ